MIWKPGLAIVSLLIESFVSTVTDFYHESWKFHPSVRRRWTNRVVSFNRNLTRHHFWSEREQIYELGRGK